MHRIVEYDDDSVDGKVDDVNHQFDHQDDRDDDLHKATNMELFSSC